MHPRLCAAHHLLLHLLEKLCLTLHRPRTVQLCFMTLSPLRLLFAIGLSTNYSCSYTIKLLSSPELSKAELPMDFSPSRPLSPLPPVIDSSSSPGSSSAAPLGSTSMMNPLAQDCSSPATESVAPVDSLHPPTRELSPEELETLRNLKIEKASQGLRTACSPVPATDPTLGSCLGSDILSPPTAHADGSSHSTSNSLSLHLLHLDRLYKLNLIAPLCERKNGVLP